MKLLRTALLLPVAVFFSGCGGSDNTTLPIMPTGVSKATVSFSVVSTATLPAGITGITLAAKLPSYVNFSTTTTPKGISSSALAVGSAFTANGVIQGRYSSDATNKYALINVATTDLTIRGGEFAKVTFSIPATAAAADFTALNTPTFPFFDAVGLTGPPVTSFSLTGNLKPFISNVALF